MDLIDLDLVIATLVAFVIGVTMKGRWRVRLALCLLVASLAWVVRAVAIFRGDVTTAEDYFSGLSIANGSAEIAIGFAWTALWCLMGRAAGSATHRMRMALR